MKLLLNAGANVNLLDKFSGRSPLQTAVEYENKNIVKLLLNAGADVNYENYLGLTILSTAAYRGLEDIVKFLLNEGFSVNHRNNSGETPLLSAVKYSGDDDIVKLFLVEGADINHKNDLGEFPLLLAVKYPDKFSLKMAKSLIAHHLLIEPQFDLRKYLTDRSYPHDPVINESELFQHGEACKEELNKIVSQLPKGSITLHQFLTSPSEDFPPNDAAVDSSNFLIYQQYYTKGIEDAKNSHCIEKSNMWSYNETRLHNDVIREVISYLTPKDKKNLVLATKLEAYDKKNSLKVGENVIQTLIQGTNATANNLYSGELVPASSARDNTPMHSRSQQLPADFSSLFPTTHTPPGA